MTTQIELRIPGNLIWGWYASLGAARILAQQWPDLTVRWGGPVGTDLILAGGPATAEEAAEAIYARTIGRMSGDQLLPGVAPGQIPEGRDFAGQVRTVVTPAPPVWSGPDGTLWQGSLIDVRGNLHPLIRPHAQQTLARILRKAAEHLRKDTALLRAALGDGLSAGTTNAYPGGLYLLRYGDEEFRASPGIDWLILMSLPWAPVLAIPPYELRNPDRHPMATGWLYGYWLRPPTGYQEKGTVRCVRWNLWQEPVPASAVTTLLRADYPVTGGDPVYAAWQPRRKGPADPPSMKPLDLSRVGFSADRGATLLHDRLTL